MDINKVRRSVLNSIKGSQGEAYISAMLACARVQCVEGHAGYSRDDILIPYSSGSMVVHINTKSGYIHRAQHELARSVHVQGKLTSSRYTGSTRNEILSGYDQEKYEYRCGAFERGIWQNECFVDELAGVSYITNFADIKDMFLYNKVWDIVVYPVKLMSIDTELYSEIVSTTVMSNVRMYNVDISILIPKYVYPNGFIGAVSGKKSSEICCNYLNNLKKIAVRAVIIRNDAIHRALDAENVVGHENINFDLSMISGSDFGESANYVINILNSNGLLY